MRGRREKRDVTGWLAIDKPSGVTSAQVVNKVKWQLSARKAGHAGTLDKPATGVLAIALGEATKTIQYVMDSRKTYTFRVKFGESTTTDDATGEILETSSVRPTDNEINAALEEFRGEIFQVPPQYSAVKVEGKRAAAHAASGKVKALKPRPLKVYRLELNSRDSAEVAEFGMECGKGGYVRSIARDLGQFLGCHAHVLELRRTAAGPFQLKDCVNFPCGADINNCGDLNRFLAPLELGLTGLTEFKCSFQDSKTIRTGVPVQFAARNHKVTTHSWVSCNGNAVAIGEFVGGFFSPKRIIRDSAHS